MIIIIVEALYSLFTFKLEEVALTQLMVDAGGGLPYGAEGDAHWKF